MREKKIKSRNQSSYKRCDSPPPLNANSCHSIDSNKLLAKEGHKKSAPTFFSKAMGQKMREKNYLKRTTSEIHSKASVNFFICVFPNYPTFCAIHGQNIYIYFFLSTFPKGRNFSCYSISLDKAK